MRQLIYSLMLTGSMIAMAACATDQEVPTASSLDGLQATEQPLRGKGVYYLRATGTAENPTFTFYDENKAVIGEGRTSHNSQLTEIQWQGNNWKSTGDAFKQNGAAVGANSADAAKRDTALSIFELSLDQIFPATSNNLSGQANPNACLTLCRRPSNRCRGACTGFVCSATDGSLGTCQPPRPPPI